MSNPFAQPHAADTSTQPATQSSLDMEEYAQCRPDYPLELVQAVADFLPSTSPDVAASATGAVPATEAEPLIVDIGAGSGIFTRQLAQELKSENKKFHIRAIEPSQQMRQTWAQENIGEVAVVSASAEHTGCAGNSVALATFAQSFHWVDTEQTAAELLRILKPGASVAVFWNQMDVSIPWVHRLTRIMRSGDVHRPDRPPKLPGFTCEPARTFQFTQQLRVPEVMKLARTRSSYFRADPQTRGRMQANLQWYLTEHLGHAADDLIALPYHTYLWRLRAAPRP